MPRFPFMPQEQSFFGLFEQSAQNMVKTAQALQEMLTTGSNVPESVAGITELEHQGDFITHQIIAQLHCTFVTPFDREDIAQLAQSLDDVTDFIHAAADSICIYKVECSTPRAIELADIIVQGALEVEKVLPLLRRRAKLKEVLPHCVEINRLENMADRVFRAAMGELFDDSLDIASVIKWREIYQYMESATDRCEDVANVLEGVALKHA